MAWLNFIKRCSSMPIACGTFMEIKDWFFIQSYKKNDTNLYPMYQCINIKNLCVSSKYLHTDKTNKVFTENSSLIVVQW